MATSLLHRIQRRANLTTPLLALHPKGRASWPFHCLHCTQKAVQVGHSIACTAPKRPCKLAIPLLHCVWHTGIIGNPSQKNETMMRGNLGQPKMHKTGFSVGVSMQFPNFTVSFSTKGNGLVSGALLIKNFSGRMAHTLNRAHHNTFKAYTSSITVGGASLTTILK